MTCIKHEVEASTPQTVEAGASVSVLPDGVGSRRQSFLMQLVASPFHISTILSGEDPSIFYSAPMPLIAFRCISYALIPQLIVWLPFLAIRLQRPTPHWQQDQVPWFIALSLANTSAFFAVPYSIFGLLTLDKAKPLDGVPWWPMLVGLVADMCVTLVIPHWFGIYGMVIPCFNWIVGVPIWCLTVSYPTWKFVEQRLCLGHQHIPTVLEAEVPQRLSTNDAAPRHRWIYFLKILFFMNFMPASGLVLIVLLVIFSTFAGRGASRLVQIIVGSGVGFGAAVLRVCTPYVIFRVVEVPIHQDVQFFIVFFIEMTSKYWYGHRLVDNASVLITH